MKKFKLVFALLAIFVATSAFAQNTQDKWLIGVGAHATDHTSVRGVFNGYFDFDDYSMVPPLSKLTVSRSLSKSFAVDLEASVGEIDNKRLKIEDEFFILAGLGLRYKLTNGYILKEDSWFDPYLRVGANYHKYAYDGIVINQANPYISYDNDYTEGGSTLGENGSYLQQDFEGKDNNFVVNGGLGINFWVTKNFGINLESQYNWAPAYNTDYADFFQHSASIVFRFGAPKIEIPCEKEGGDADGDTVCENVDNCPGVPGLVELQGCPKPTDPCEGKGGDTDKDGICDKDDKCPKDKTNDADGDGVCEDVDSCPGVKGLKAFNGCPDTDGDGVADKDDACPKVYGLKSLNGCPDEVGDKLTLILKGLLFDTNKHTIKKGQESKITDAVAVLNQYPNVNLYVDGHTDSDGSETLNYNLSQRRAAEVVKALEAKGVAKGRLTPRAFGESNPTAECLDNAKACKHLNRRVELYDVKSEKAPSAISAPVEEVKKAVKNTETKAKEAAKAVKTEVKKVVK